MATNHSPASPDALHKIVEQVKEYYIEPSTRYPGGRPRVFSGQAFLLLAVVGVVLRIFKAQELCTLLTKEGSLRERLGVSRVPHRRTVERRLDATLLEAEAQVARLGQQVLAEVVPGPDHPQASAIDGRMYQAQGPLWHKRDREQERIPARLRNVDTESAWSSRLYTTEDQGHGREEHRTVQVLPARGALSAAQVALWVGVLSIVMVTRVVWCEATGKESFEVSYFLSSLPPYARRIGAAIRGHWSIENGLHWVLDVVFREDARRVYDRTTAENVASLNRLAVSLLRGDPTKSSLKVKRKRAGWQIPYLRQLLGFPCT